MTVKNVTISGVLCTSDDKPLANTNVDVYQLTDLFHATVLTQFKTNELGKYEFTYPMSGLIDSLALIGSNRGKGEPLLKKFLHVTESHPDVTIHSPAAQQKKRRSTHRQSRVQHSPSDKLAKKSWGPDWEIKVMEAIPDKTTESIQESFRSDPIPDDEQDQLAFLFNSLFWNPPEKSEKGKRLRYAVTLDGLDQYARKEIPEATIDLQRIKGLFYIEKVALRFQNEEWKECTPKDPEYKRFRYLANSAAIIKGLSSRLVGLRFVLPSLYSQAFLSTISEKNPLRVLLGAHLTDSYLIDNHLGLPLQKPLIEVTKCSDVSPAEMVQLLLEQLLSPPFVMPSKPTVQDNFAKGFYFYRDQIVKPTIADFFECNRHHFENSRERPENKFWGEIYAMSKTFASLHPLNATHQEGWWKPFIENPHTPGKGEIQKLKDWCENALLLNTLLPYVINKNLDYLTDLRFATLKPVHQALQDDNATLEEFGGTTPDQAIKHLSKTNHCIETVGTPLKDQLGKHPSINKYLKEHAEELRAYDINPKELFVTSPGT